MCVGGERSSTGAWVARGTYALWRRGAWEAGRLHEVPLGLALQSCGAWQCHVRLRWEKRHHHPVLASKKARCDESEDQSPGVTHPATPSPPLPPCSWARTRFQHLMQERQTDRLTNRQTETQTVRQTDRDRLTGSQSDE